jgi:hypothetical protein
LGGERLRLGVKVGIELVGLLNSSFKVVEDQLLGHATEMAKRTFKVKDECLCTTIRANLVFRAGFSGSGCELFNACSSGSEDCGELRRSLQCHLVMLSLWYLADQTMGAKQSLETANSIGLRATLLFGWIAGESGECHDAKTAHEAFRPEAEVSGKPPEGADCVR